MSEIDAAKLATRRCCPPGSCKRSEADRDDSCFRDALLDALEKARGERDGALEAQGGIWIGVREAEAACNKAIAERDSARTLLREAHANVANWGNNGSDLRARIVAELEPKP